MKKIFTTLTLLLIAGSFYGQDTLPDTTVYDNRVCIKIAPLSLLDIWCGSSPRAGIEFKLRHNLALYAEAGTYLPNANGMSKNTGGLGKLELKMYLNKRKFSSGRYVSVEYFYKQQAYYTYDSINIPSDKNYRKDFSVSKKVSCFTLKYGFMQIDKSGFIFDGFIGLGLRNKNVSSSLSDIENRNIKADGDYSPNILTDKAGMFNLLNFELGLKIGYRLK